MKRDDGPLEEWPYPGFGWQVAKCVFLFYGTLIAIFAILLLCGAFQ